MASSDATNIRTSIRKEGNEIVINGHKWWISGAGDPRTKLHLVMGKSDASNPNTHSQQSIVIVPADASGVNIIRPMRVFGYDDAPEGHCEIIYDNVRVPINNLVAGWGRGFEVRSLYLLPCCHTESCLHRLYKAVWGIALYSQRLHLLNLISPGRIHHCMRSIGVAQRALDLMLERVTDPTRKTFGKYLYQHGVFFDVGASPHP